MVLFARLCQAVTGVVSGMSAVYLGYVGYHHGLSLRKGHNEQSRIFSTNSFNTVTRTIFPTVTADVCIPNAGGYLDYYVTTTTFPSTFSNLSSVEPSAENKSVIIHCLDRLSFYIERFTNLKIAGLPINWIIDALFFLIYFSWTTIRHLITNKPSTDSPAVFSHGKGTKVTPRMRQNQRHPRPAIRAAHTRLVSPMSISTRLTNANARWKMFRRISQNVSQLSKTSESITTELGNSRAQVESYQIQVTELEKQLAASRSQTEQVQIHSDTVQSEKIDQEHTVTSVKRELQDSQTKRQNLEQDIILLKRALDGTQSENEAREQECESFTRQITALESEKSAREHECEILKQQLTVMKSQKVGDTALDKLKTKREEEAFKELEEVKKELKAITQDLESSKTHADSLQDQFDRMKTAKGTIEKQRNTFKIEAQALRGRIEKLQGSIDEYMAINESLTDEMKDLKNKITEDTAIAVATAATVKDNETNLKKEMSVLASKLGIVHSETITLREEYRDKDNAHAASLKEKDTQLQASKKETDELRTRKQILESDLQKVSDELAAATRSRKEAEDLQMQLKSQVNSLQDHLKNKSQSKPFHTVPDSGDKYPAAPNIDMKELEINRVKFDNKDLAEKNKGLVEQIFELKKENARLSKENVNLGNEFKKEESEELSQQVESTTNPAATANPVTARPSPEATRSFAKTVKDEATQATPRTPSSVAELAKKGSLLSSKYAGVSWTPLPPKQISQSRAHASTAVSPQAGTASLSDTEQRQTQSENVNQEVSSSSTIEVAAECQSKDIERGQASTPVTSAAPLIYDWRMDRSLTQDQKILLADGHSLEAILGADYLAKKKQETSKAASAGASNPLYAEALGSVTHVNSTPTHTSLSTSAATSDAASTSANVSEVVRKTSSQVNGAAEVRKSKWADEPVSSSTTTTEMSSSKFVTPFSSNTSLPLADIPTAPRSMREAAGGLPPFGQDGVMATGNARDPARHNSSPARHSGLLGRGTTAPIKQARYAATTEEVPVIYRFDEATGTYRTKDPEKRREQYNRQLYNKTKQENCRNGWRAMDTLPPSDKSWLSRPRPVNDSYI